MRNKLENIITYIFAIFVFIRLCILFKMNKIPYKKVENEYFNFLAQMEVEEYEDSFYRSYKLIINKTKNEFFEQIRKDGTLHKINFANKLDKL